MKLQSLSQSSATRGLLALYLAALPCTAATKAWDGEASTLNWGDATNWNTDGVPAINDAIQFNSGGVAAAATVAVNVGTYSASVGTASLTLNNGAGFTLDFNVTGGNNNYIPTVAVGDAFAYTINSASGKAFAIPNSSQATQTFNIANGGKLSCTGDLVVAGYGSSAISKTGDGEVDLTGLTGVSSSRIGSISVSGGTLRAKVAGSAYFTSSAASGIYLKGTAGSSVVTAQSRSVAVSSMLSLDGVTLTNDALNTTWASTTATVNLTNGGGLDVRGQSNVSIDTLTGTGKVYNSYSSGKLTVGANGGSSTFDGVIYGNAGVSGTQNYGLYDGNAGTLGLTKTGSGSLTLTGANVYSGATTVNGGNLVLAGGDNRLLPTGSITLGGASAICKLVLGNAAGAVNQTLAGLSSVGNGGAVVGAHGSIPSVFTLNIPAGESHSNGTLGGAGSNENNLALTKTGVGTLYLSGTNTYLGATTITGGTVKLENPVAGLPAGLQIMPMGDSITYGASPASGYRNYLYNLLSPEASGFQFVGASTLSSGSLPTSPINQTHHNGYSSYATLDLANNLDGLDTACYDHWTGADRNPNGGYWFTGEHGTGRAAVFPDVILLMVGTNDINQGGAANPNITIPNYQANLTTLIDRIVTLRPDARLLVAKMTPYPNQAANLAAMNEIVATVVSGFQTQGKRVSLVDLHTNFPADGLSGDGVHPNATGYSFMATKWHDAIVAAYSSASPGAGVNQGISAASAVNVAAGATLDVNGFTATLGGLAGAGNVALGSGGILTVASANTNLFDGSLSGAGSLIKSGAGMLALSGTNTHTGMTTVNEGTLQLTGSLAGALNVQTGGTLAGNGSVTGAATIASTGILSPGDNSLATLHFGASLDLAAGSTYAATITAAATNDKVAVTGTLTANGTIKVTLSGYTPAAGDSFNLADAASITGTPVFDFSNASPGTELAWDTSKFTTDGTIKLVPADPYAAWATLHGVTGGKSGDDDGDGVTNLLEFATAGDAKSAASGVRAYPLLHTLGGKLVLTYTLAVRAGAIFTANGARQQADQDQIRYAVEASNHLTDWNSQAVTPLNAEDTTAVRNALGSLLDGLDPAWEWQSFRTTGDTSVNPADFIRLAVTESP